MDTETTPVDGSSWPSRCFRSNSGSLIQPPDPASIPLAARRGTSLPGWIARSSRGSSSILKTGHCPGETASGDGLWLRHDLLEPLARLAGRGVWDPDPPDLVEPPPFCGPDRLSNGSIVRHEPCPCRQGGDRGEEEPPPAPRRSLEIGQANTRFSTETVKACPWSSMDHPRRTLRDGQSGQCRWWMPFLRSPASPATPGNARDHVMGRHGGPLMTKRSEQKLRNRGIDPELAKRRTPHGSGLGSVSLGGGANDQLVSSVPPAPCALRSPRRYPLCI